MGLVKFFQLVNSNLVPFGVFCLHKTAPFDVAAASAAHNGSLSSSIPGQSSFIWGVLFSFSVSNCGCLHVNVFEFVVNWVRNRVSEHEQLARPKNWDVLGFVVKMCHAYLKVGIMYNYYIYYIYRYKYHLEHDVLNFLTIFSYVYNIGTYKLLNIYCLFVAVHQLYKPNETRVHNRAVSLGSPPRPVHKVHIDRNNKPVGA